MGTTPGGGFPDPQPEPEPDDPHDPVIIPIALPCGGLITCGSQTPYGYVASLLPFTSSDACYFLTQDPVLCNSSAWPDLPSVISTTGNPLSFTVNYCGNISGLACAANLSQDVATLVDLVGVGLIEAPLVATGCVEAGPLGCAIAEVGVAATWTVTLNTAETAASGTSFLLTWADDVANNGGWGENSSTSFTTLLAGQLPLTPSYDLVVDTYSSGYNHGLFNGVYTIWTDGLFK